MADTEIFFDISRGRFFLCNAGRFRLSRLQRSVLTLMISLMIDSLTRQYFSVPSLECLFFLRRFFEHLPAAFSLGVRRCQLSAMAPSPLPWPWGLPVV